MTGLFPVNFYDLKHPVWTYLGSDWATSLFRFSYPNWFSIVTTSIGAKDWAGLVNKALVPKTIEESGDLKYLGEKPKWMHNTNLLVY